MFARFDENPAMTLRVIKETKRYGRTDGRKDARTDARTDGRTDNVKTVYPLQTKFAGGIIKCLILIRALKTKIGIMVPSNINESTRLNLTSKCIFLKVGEMFNMKYKPLLTLCIYTNELFLLV